VKWRPASSPFEGGHAAIEAGRTGHDALVGQLHSSGVECPPIAPQSPGHDTLERRADGAAFDPEIGWLNGQNQELGVLKIQEMPGSRECAALVVNGDRAVLGERSRIYEHDRQARTPDLLDLGVVLAQADGDEAVDARLARRPRQRSVERRDEQQTIAELLGDAGHPLAEHAEERVGKRDNEGLRRQDAEGAGAALREHPGHRVGPITELIGNRANPGRRPDA